MTVGRLPLKSSPIAGAKPAPPPLDLPQTNRHEHSTCTTPDTLDVFHRAGRARTLPEAVSPLFRGPSPTRQRTSTGLQIAVLANAEANLGTYASLLSSRLPSSVPLEQLRRDQGGFCYVCINSVATPSSSCAWSSRPNLAPNQCSFSTSASDGRIRLDPYCSSHPAASAARR